MALYPAFIPSPRGPGYNGPMAGLSSHAPLVEAAQPAQLARRAQRVYALLLETYGEPAWRNPLPAIDELVSTILSQNTNDVNRDRAYTALRARFPTWAAVESAPTAEVVDAIRSAGLADRKSVV